MKKTFVDVMLELPVDATLRDFLTAHGLPVPDGFAFPRTRTRPASPGVGQDLMIMRLDPDVLATGAVESGPRR